MTPPLKIVDIAIAVNVHIAATDEALVLAMVMGLHDGHQRQDALSHEHHDVVVPYDVHTPGTAYG
jgi:ammonia channel protein AmtB